MKNFYTRLVDWIHAGYGMGSQRIVKFLELGKQLPIQGNTVDPLTLHEPVKIRPSRLYIDVTWTAGMNHTSGIERVVRKICQSFTFNNLLKDRTEPVLCFSNRKKYFCRAFISQDGIISVDRLWRRKAITLAARDRVLMLDMSWKYCSIHRHILQNARVNGVQIFSCLFDMVPIKFSAMCYEGTSLDYTQWLESALSVSTGFVCISKAVADELLELLNAIKFPRPLKVGYWPLGSDIKSSATTQPHRRSFNTEQPKFLMVGTIEPRKNHLLVLRAFSELWAEGFGGTLTIIGRRGWSDEHIVLAIEKNKEFGRKLRWLKNANDDILVESYKANDVLIAASYAEGFGLPIVEGLQHGCQVLASDIPVFREAAGNSASVRYFIPESRQSLMDKVQTTAVVLSVNEINDSPVWIDWKESARRLAEVIIDNKWYQEYIPPEPMTGLSAGIGSTHITRKLSHNETKHRLAIVGPVARLNSGRSLKYTVKVTNESKELFSSRGNSDGSLGIYLGYHIIARDGGMLKFKNPHSKIPFVIPPGDSVYLPVEINLWSLPYNAAFLDLEMVQEGGEWWGQPLRVGIYE